MLCVCGGGGGRGAPARACVTAKCAPGNARSAWSSATSWRTSPAALASSTTRRRHRRQSQRRSLSDARRRCGQQCACPGQAQHRGTRTVANIIEKTGFGRAQEARVAQASTTHTHSHTCTKHIAQCLQYQHHDTPSLSTHKGARPAAPVLRQRTTPTTRGSPRRPQLARHAADDDQARQSIRCVHNQPRRATRHVGQES